MIHEVFDILPLQDRLDPNAMIPPQQNSIPEPINIQSPVKDIQNL